ncbi:MAG: hypothetical protein ACLSDA_12810, partial [[Eubacterium] siraeum]
FPLSNFCLKSVALDLTIYLAPVKFPFPGERGQGDRDSELEVCFKNKLFLQTDAPVLTGAFFLIILTLNRCNDTIEI